MRALVGAVSLLMVFSLAGTASAQSCPNGGVALGGSCWYLGALGASCDATCSAAGPGLQYDGATETFAGSGGTDQNCGDVLDGLGVAGSGATATVCNIGGVGCTLTPSGSFRGRCAFPATDSSSADQTVERACACGRSARTGVPTLNPFGMAAVVASLLGFGFFHLRRRPR